MTKLSVNINKIAYLRNTRHLDIPDPVDAARIAIDAGADGITVHPRPDQRHIRPDDVRRLALFLKGYSHIEFNIEGNPFEGQFMELIKETRPAQCTLVPDEPDVFTSDAGWQIQGQLKKIQDIITEIKRYSRRVSLFMDAGTAELPLVKQVGSDRIELYTESYASSFTKKNRDDILESFVQTAAQANDLGLGVNAGHDLNLDNLALFLNSVPCVLEVSIGHALVAEAVFSGLSKTVQKYLEICQNY